MKKEAVYSGGLSVPMEFIPEIALEKIKKELTWTFEADQYSKEDVVVEGFFIADGIITIPRGRADLLEGIISDFKEDYASPRGLTCKDGTKVHLRDKDQETFVERIWDQLKIGKSAYGVAATGLGKTVLAIELMKRLREPVAIVVHKEFITKHWTEMISTGKTQDGKFMAPFWPEASVGYCQANKCDTGNTHDIVICMVQSIASHPYPEEFYKSFGLVVYDEADKMASSHWGKAMFKFTARRQLMMSATPKRFDGLEELQFMQVSPITVQVNRPNMMPRIVTKETGYSVSRYWERYKGTFPRSRLLTSMSKDEPRNLLILGDILKAIEAGRRIIVFSDRLFQLNYFKDKLEEYGFKDAALYVGGMKKAAQEKAEQAQVILATYKCVDSALDVPSIDCGFVTTPRSALDQFVGRTLRMKDGKKEPVFVIYKDDIKEFSGPIVGALAKFRAKGYNVQPIKEIKKVG